MTITWTQGRDNTLLLYDADGRTMNIEAGTSYIALVTSHRTGADRYQFQRRSDPWINKKTSARRNAEVFFYFQAAARAVRGAGFFFRSNGFALRAGQRQGWFFV